MLTGVVAAKLITVLSLVLLARIYSTDAFGLLGLFQAVVVTVSVAATLGFSSAIALPEKDEEAATVLWLGATVLAGFTTLAAAAVPFLAPAMARWMDAPALATLLWFGPVYLCCVGAFEILGHWSTRQHALRRLAASSVLLALAVAGMQIGAFGVGNRTSGLVVGTVLGTAIAVLVLALQTWTADRSVLTGGWSWDGIRAAASAHRQFPQFQAPAAIIAAGSASLIPLGLGYFFGTATVGMFWLADRVCAYLTNLVRQSMQQVFLNRAAELAHAGDHSARLFRRTTLALFGLALPPTAALVLAGPTIFGIAFGAEWTGAGVLARWLSIAWLFNLLNIPALQLVAVYRRQRWTLLYSLGQAAFRALAILLGGALADPLIVVGIYAGGNAAGTVLLIVGVSRYLPTHAHIDGTDLAIADTYD